MPQVNSNLMNVFMATALAALVVFILIVGQNILIPLVIALLVAYFIIAIADGIASVRFLTIPIFKPFAMLASILIVFSAFYLLGNVVMENANVVAAQAPAYQASLDMRIQEVYTYLNLENPPTVSEIIATVTQDPLNNADIGSIAQRILGGLTGFAGSVFAIFIYTVS